MKRTVRQNRYDNWYGYEGGKRVIAFGNSKEFTAEQAAQQWQAEGAKTEKVLKKERNQARAASPMVGQDYSDVSARLDREYAAKQALLDHVDRFGSITVQVGTEGRRRFGYRKLAQLMGFVNAGVLERVPTSGGVTPIMAKARHLNNKVRGYATEHTFRRKR